MNKGIEGQLSYSSAVPARINRSLSPWKVAAHAVSRSGQIVRCARTFENWTRITAIYGGAELPKGFSARGRRGFTLPLQCPTDVQTAWVVFCTGEYFVPMDCETVLDLGANIGAFSIYANRCRGAKRIYALEPVAATFSSLQSNLEANGITNVTTVRKGIGRQSERRTMNLGVASPHASIIYRGDPRFESGETEEVEIITLERLFAELNLDQVDMAKMDCEGGEVEAILAASDETLRRIRHLSLEYHYPAGISNDTEFFGRMARAGFRCVQQSRIGRLAQFVRE